ncbi:PRC-barrel domain-containing protein [Mesorhizobium sp. CAU 1741]|uniref:PRC-barrel domain-containing protein n=1 Tax=Mesorhizobium sp. CAU 1741 TaxID=3140366 RepID=UPI00325BA247
MKTRQFTLAVAAASMMGGAAFAQGTWVEIEDTIQVPTFEATVDQIDDWDVSNVGGSVIGEVEEVVGTDANTPTALVIDLEGNEGYADRDVVVPFDQFTLDGDRLTLRADPAAAAQMEEWSD